MSTRRRLPLPVRLLYMAIIGVIVIISNNNTIISTESSSSSSTNGVPAIQQPESLQLQLQALFRETMAAWRTAMSSSSSQRQQQQQQCWQPWIQFAVKLQQLLFVEEQEQEEDQQHDIKLDIVGAYEEGILAIERDIHLKSQQTQGGAAQGVDHNNDDAPLLRDVALSQLYTGYAQLLTRLTAEECWQLASDPHTLLIGANTVTKQRSLASTALCLENAENSARNAIALDTNNTQAHELLQSILFENGANSINDGSSSSSTTTRRTEFVAELFDSVADSFDETLVQNLKYQVPELVGDLAKQMIINGEVRLQRRLPTSNNNIDNGDNRHSYYYHAVLDAGCGTGLAGRHLRPLIYNNSTTGNGGGSGSGSDCNQGGIMIGVDASRKMLDKAAQCTRFAGCGVLRNSNNNNINKESEDNRPLYDNLLQMDLLDMTINNTLGTMQKEKAFGSDKNDDMNNNSDGFDLVVAADVLVYFGNLDRIIRAFASVSRHGAILIFSTELLPPPPMDEASDSGNGEAAAAAGWRLLPLSGRFAHTKQHAIDVATRHGYKLVSYQEIIPRMEKGEPVQGQLFAFVLEAKQDNDDGMLTAAAAASHDDTNDQRQHGNEL